MTFEHLFAENEAPLTFNQFSDEYAFKRRLSEKEASLARLFDENEAPLARLFDENDAPLDGLFDENKAPLDGLFRKRGSTYIQAPLRRKWDSTHFQASLQWRKQRFTPHLFDENKAGLAFEHLFAENEAQLVRPST